MEYGAIAIAVVGFCLGLGFRLKVLLPFLAVLLIATTVLAAFRSYGLLDSVVTTVSAQFIIQGGYFVGLLTRWLLGSDSRGTRLV